MISTGFHRYTPENPLPGVVYIRDSEGRDWYTLRDAYQCDTMKYAFDDQHRLLAFAPSIVFFPPIGTVTECPRHQWPAFVSLNALWEADAEGVRCKVENLPQRMGQCANAFAALAHRYPDTTTVLTAWRKQAQWPYVPFPRFGEAQVADVVQLTTLTRAEYDQLSRP